MVLAALMVVAGLAFVVTGLHLALSRPRPVNLAGALLAPLGLALALWGAARLLSPGF